ncbi:SSI family serine proteinase inhibitor [Streptomyces sp.]|uniref:SSI family serine proteinase inhibitor n=1 Tax=Streptomyces sp. TaxID=1931 RepID=UPI002D3F6AEF|nr:SSI family serine proteinase inhibitor [Streptomyces sp.]HZF92958.1 SSI family serine proteinase inhibitor [Streptomyces sp.]
MTYTLTVKAVRRGLPATAALFAVLAAGAVPARAAAEPVRETGPRTWLHLTVTRGDILPPGPRPLRPAGHRDTRGTLLLCEPPLGHGRAAEACAQLDAANGDIRRIPMRKGTCPMVYAPVTAQARGMWQGRPVDYRETFSNACAMEAVTGALFALDG